MPIQRAKPRFSEVKNVSIATSTLPAGTILQVQHAIKKDIQSIGSSSYTNITGLAITFTPKASNSKLIIMPMVNIQGYGEGHTAQIRAVVTDGSDTPDADFAVGDTASSRTRSMMGNFASASTDGNHMMSPTTGMVEYQITSTNSHVVNIQLKTQGGNTLYLNRTMNDADNTDWATRNVSSLTIMEVAQ